MYTFSEKCREARRAGGIARAKTTDMAELGRRGAIATWTKYKLMPIGTSYYVMVCRKTGKVIATITR